jgi:hypothetical protein
MGVVCDTVGADDAGGLWRGHADADAGAADRYAAGDRHPGADGYASAHGDDNGVRDGDCNADGFTFPHDN